MTYKTILVHVEADERSTVRLELAAALARRFDAHLIGLNVQPLIGLPACVAGDPLLADQQQQAAARAAAAAEARFAAAVASCGLASVEWREDDQGLAAALLQHARYADLLVVGQRDPAQRRNGAGEVAAGVLLAAGRPLLVVPYAGRFADCGRRALVAWNASREAARALTDALPLLRAAEVVRVLTVNPCRSDHGELPGADIGLYLARHGVRVEVVRDEAAGLDIGSELLSRAADFAADLVVMGAWGRSRMRERMLGGATRTLLESMTAPVLMSH